MQIKLLARGFSAVLALVLVMHGAAAHATSQCSCVVSHDTSINSAVPNNANGGNASLVAGYDGNKSGANAVAPHGALRSLIQFLIPAALTNKVTVSSVQVKLTSLALGNPALAAPGDPMNLWRITQGWVEGSLSGQVTRGTACSGGAGATWNDASCGITGWSIDGATNSGVNHAGPNSLSANPLVWTSNTCTANTMCADVQGWIDTPTSNHGYVLTADESRGNPPHNDALPPRVQRFYSSEGAAAVNNAFAPQLIINYTACDTNAINACKAGNSCFDSGSTNCIPSYTCGCGTGFSGSGTTACTDINECFGNPCDGTNKLATCTDEPAPSLSYACTCSVGWSAPAHGGSCQSACVTGNPCAIGSGGTSCTPNPTGGAGYTCGCSAGYVSSPTGSLTPTCVHQNTCTGGPATGDINCQAGTGGNSCHDDPPTSYDCTCGPGYTHKTGPERCVDDDGCADNPGACTVNGDTMATCTNNSPPTVAAYTCNCDPLSTNNGYTFNGVGCVKSCTGTSNPCASGGGTCMATSTTTWSCITCGMGYATTGGSTPACAPFDACNNGPGNAGCVVANGNVCNDQLPPSNTYTCTCNGGYQGTGTTSCMNRDDCVGNPCGASGDAGTLLHCTDVPAPGTSYMCTCDTAFTAPATGGSCVNQCNGGSNPCDIGLGGTCALAGAGGWTCTCPLGTKSVGSPLPTCQNIDACDTAALADCTSFAGNGCLDDQPPSLTYHCNCSNPGTENGTGMDGNPACVNHDECKTVNHCADQGDLLSTCVDHPAPALGYDCTCSSPTLWQNQTVGGNLTCVDVDECLVPTDPCLHGTCSNVGLGGGYSCVCAAGYISDNPPTPTCVHPGGCTADALVACVTSAAGNVCVDTLPPLIGHTCKCENPAYVESSDKSKCVDRNKCGTDPCALDGDSKSDCTDHKAPDPGYDCACSPGFTFDGTMCADVNECLQSPNPCGQGTCSNTKGSYTCACPGGFKFEATPKPACVATAGGGRHVVVTESKGGCATNGTPPVESALFVMLALLALAHRRARS